VSSPPPVRAFTSTIPKPTTGISLILETANGHHFQRPPSHLDSAKESLQIPCITQSTLTSKNQTTIPKAVVEALQLRPSDQLVYEIEKDGRVILTAKTGTFASVAASLPHRNNAASSRSIDEMKAAVKTMARKRMTRAEP